MTTLAHAVTSFASLLINAGRIRTIVSDTGAQYIDKRVIETFPNGMTRRAVIKEIAWENSVGLHGDWMIFVTYLDNDYVNKKLVTPPGAWVSRDVLTLAEGE